MLNLKKIAIASMMSLPLAVASVPAFADNDDVIERQVQQDKNFKKVKKQAIKKLKAQGYQVTKVEADDYQSQPALSVDAHKGGKEYDIKLAYPSLDVLKHEADDDNDD